MKELDGNDWTHKVARLSFPILVDCARRRRTITYGELDATLVRRKLSHYVFPTQYGYPAGRIGNTCLEYRAAKGQHVPPINLIVVNAATKLPGRGADPYIAWYCRRFLKRNVDPESLSLRARRSIIAQAHEEIFDFRHWNEFLSAYGLTKAKAEPDTTLFVWGNTKAYVSGWARGGEGKAHEALKAHVKQNPEIAGLPRTAKGRTEHKVPSGDRVDVFFQAAALAVEVKPANSAEGEKHRSIFQCVKYRGLIRAQQQHDRQIPDGDSVLVIGDALPNELRATRYREGKAVGAIRL